MIIAIDGPAASGKGTLAKRLATHYGLPHLDTGLLYRAVAPRYRAPESTWWKPSTSATQWAVLDLPEAAGPSIAITMRARSWRRSVMRPI